MIELSLSEAVRNTPGTNSRFMPSTASVDSRFMASAVGKVALARRKSRMERYIFACITGYLVDSVANRKSGASL